MAPLAYICSLAFILSIVVGTLALDFVLIVEGDETISMWLRNHPGWFIVPALAIVGALVALAAHLYWG